MILPDPPQVGIILSPNDFDVIKRTKLIGELFGVELTRDAALIILAALLFLFGASLSCILKINGSERCCKVLISSIFTFFFTSPGWVYTLENKWLDESIPLLDAVFRFIKGAGHLASSFFALSIVILMGMFSWTLLQYIVRVFPRVGCFLVRMWRASIAPSTEENSSTEDSQERTDAGRASD